MWPQNIEFLKKYKNLLTTNTQDLYDFIVTLYDTPTLGRIPRKEMLEEILPKVIPQEIITSLLWERLERYILEELKYWKSNNWRNSSGDWARLQFVLEDINCDFNYEEVVDHLMKNRDRLNLKMIPLEPIYSREGAYEDYDLLGVFDKQKYERENPDLFGD